MSNEFLAQGFEYLARYFENSLNELESRNSHVETTFRLMPIGWHRRAGETGQYLLLAGGIRNKVLRRTDTSEIHGLSFRVKLVLAFIWKAMVVVSHLV